MKRITLIDAVSQISEALHIADREAVEVAERMMKRFGLDYLPDPVTILEDVDFIIGGLRDVEVEP